MPNIIIVIPTYWTWSSQQTDGPVETFYDHPTPTDSESTLPRLLHSLAAWEGPAFSVLILTATAHSDMDQAAASTVERLISPFRAHYPIAQATETDAALIRQRHPRLAAHVQMRGYAGVRNLQLLLSRTLRAEIVIALDDDEVVEPDYLRVATEWVGREHYGEPVLGLAGFYLDLDGEVVVSEGLHTGNIYLDKPAIMNEGTRALQSAPSRLVPTPVAFGGNMIFHRNLFTQVGFDPGITRGEDIDYLINARLAGFSFWLDKKLVITHLPPHQYNLSPYIKLAEDVRRFIYEQEKLRLALKHNAFPLTPADLMPYPGRFLNDDAMNQARAALETIATPELEQAYGTPSQIITQAQAHARQIAPNYFDFAQSWPRLMDAVAGDDVLCDRLAARLLLDT
ncbi:MAG TPA: hypothetical protein G4N94_06855 [Caldilineae bacterium]|nr:hypothetical protein [Caldilineae bacterium]